MKKTCLTFASNEKGKIYIYGTGKFGRAIKAYLYEYLEDILITGFIVSDGLKDVDTIEGIPVYNLSEVTFLEEDRIIVGADSWFFHDIIPNIICSKCRNVYVLNAAEKASALVVAKLKEKEICVSDDIIDCGSFKIPNLFLKAKDDMASLIIYALEFGDLVLPYLGDESMIDEGVYEYNDVNLESIPGGGVVLDCGANVGTFSARAAAMGLDVYAFEPAPVPIKWLEMTKKLYKDSIHIEKYALADYEGKTQFYLSDSSIGAGSIEDRGNKGEKIDVDVTTVDNFVEKNNLQRVDFIKADIEGAERQMLRGARKTLKNFAPQLSLCTYHCFDDISAMTDIILEANPNYKIVYAWKKLYAWVEK
ncbi:MAG TPA: hypothetical protein DHV96_12085 [Lachnospiraceae bacterium]|nr:hypothetical protein [Lachnospiraceae bacterium]